MTDQVTMIDVATLRSWLDAGEVVLVDVREPHEFAAGHIKGAILKPLSTWDPDELPEVPAGKKLVLQCRSANRCGVATANLLENGYQGKIHRLAGGFLAWVAAGQPQEV